MEVLYQKIVQLAIGSELYQYFFVGALGALFFDLTLIFNDELRVIAQKKGIKSSMSYNIIFIFCNTLYSASLGGIMAIWVDYALWLAFFVGFFHSIFFTFVVKTLLLNSMEKAFWVTIGKICVSILLNPSKKLITVLEELTKKENDKSK